MFTVLIKQFFGFLITVMASFTNFSNSQTMEKTEMVFVVIVIMFIFFQTNDMTTVFNVVREFGWISKWVYSHHKINAKTDNAFNDLFGVRTLIFEVRWKIFGS